MLMMRMRTQVATEGILQRSTVVKHFVHDPLIYKSFECAIYGYTVKNIRNFTFYVSIGQCEWLF